MTDLFSLRGKTALITGAGHGIGAACARLFAEMGAQVMASDIDADAVKGVAQTCQSDGLDVQSISHDVTSEHDWANVTDAVHSKYSNWNVLVNNAGIYIGGLVEQNQVADVRKINTVNIESIFLGTKFATQSMKPGGRSGGGGSIINMSSVASIMGLPGHSVYGATKGAVESYTRHTAVEAARMGFGIRINSLHPGLIATQMGAMVFDDFVDIGMAKSREDAEAIALSMTPIGRFGAVEDVASAAVFLASEASSYMTGSAMTVDGGASAS